MSQSGHFRAHARHQVDFSAELDLVAAVAPAPATLGSSRRRVRIVNLSLAGACIESAEPLATGALATVEVVSSILWDPLVVRGRVVWSRGGREKSKRAGLCFLHEDAAQAFALFELLGAHEYDV
jgi:hypothetical protein